MSILVSNYDQSWPANFEQLKKLIWPTVSDFAVGIEHVGSTSVPGLAAKPVIDIDIVISSGSDLQRAIQRLQELGYAYQGNLGIEGREAFSTPPSLIKHNLYVCLEDSLALRNHLALRDTLRKNPSYRNQYGELKKQLAAKHPDSIDDYIDGKTDLITSILRNEGFKVDDLNVIEFANKKAKH